MPPSGGKLRTLVPFTGPFANAYAFVFDGTDFYIMGTDASSSTQSIVRVPAGGGCATLIATMPVSEGKALAVDDECIYWSNADGLFSLGKSIFEPFRQ
jgi:hypothetical protein